MNEIEFLSKNSALIISFVVFVAWLIRLESKVLFLEKELARHIVQTEKEKTSLWSKFDAMQVTINSMLQLLTEIKTKLEFKEKQ